MALLLVVVVADVAVPAFLDVELHLGVRAQAVTYPLCPHSARIYVLTC